MEIWRDINFEDYGEYYQVSNYGNVRSKDRYVKANKNGGIKLLKGQPMKLTVNKAYRNDAKTGYTVVNLRKEGKNKVAVVHRLVALTFIPNDDTTKEFVNHIDGDKTNNTVENLEWVTTGENNQHAFNTGLRNPRGVRVEQCDLNNNLIAVYKSVTEASKQTGISRGSISHNINGRQKTCGEFVFIKQ